MREATSAAAVRPVSIYRPSSEDRRWAAAAVVLSVPLLLPRAFWELPVGLSATGGLRVLEGDVPYRDFWTIYAPGMYYAAAAVYAVFGRELLAQALAAVAISSLSVGAFFWVLRHASIGRAAAGVLAAAFAVSVWAHSTEITSYPPALLFLLVGWGHVLGYFGSGRSVALLAAGACFGIAACFKHDVGFYGAASSGATVALAWLAAAGRRPEIWLRPARALAWLGAGCALVVLPVVGLIAWAAGTDAWHDLIVFPATAFPQVRREPYASWKPPLGAVLWWLADVGDLRAGNAAGNAVRAWLLCRLPELVFALGAIALTAVRQRLHPATLGAGLLPLCAIPFFWSAAHMQQNTHLFSMGTLSLLILALAWDWWPRIAPDRRRLRPFVLALGAVYVAALSIHSGMGAFWMLHSWRDGRTLEVPGARGIRVADWEYEIYDPIARFVRAHVPEDEAIYVGVKRHDAIVITNQRFFPLTDRRSATRYNELHPGVTDRESVQREMVEAIERAGVRCAIIWEFGWPDSNLDLRRDRFARANPDGGSTLLDEFIAREFEPLAQYGEYVVMWRKGATRPEAVIALDRGPSR